MAMSVWCVHASDSGGLCGESVDLISYYIDISVSIYDFMIFYKMVYV